MSWISGRRVLITGPTSGIGKQIALELGAQGAELVLACRDTTKGVAVAQEIAALTGAIGTPVVMHVDASSQRSLRAFSRSVHERYPRLDVLVNNAGTVQRERLESEDGIELTFATNVLGYHLLTTDLLGLLTGGAPARVVVVASTFASDLDLGDPQFTRRPFDGLQAYAQSKACNRLFTWALARRLAGTGVTANAMAPGFVPGTELSRNLAPETRRAYKERSGRTMAQGSDTAVWLASSPDVAGTSGGFFFDRKALTCQFRGTAAEERLWDICEGLITA